VSFSSPLIFNSSKLYQYRERSSHKSSKGLKANDLVSVEEKEDLNDNIPVLVINKNKNKKNDNIPAQQKLKR
jgi:hypothetical protein